MALNNMHKMTHEPEALRIVKLCVSIFLLDYTLLQVANLSKIWQAENLDLTAIAALVDAKLQVLDDAMLPAAKWNIVLTTILVQINSIADSARTRKALHWSQTDIRVRDSLGTRLVMAIHTALAYN